MVIRSYYKLLSPGATVPVAAFDGTPPYVFTIKPGGIGGTIDAAGVYTAPQKIGTDTIIATDSLLETAEYVIGTGTALHFIADIIRKKLSLGEDQVVIQNQKYDQPKDSRLYISVKMLTARAIANRNHFSDTAEEGQSVNMFGPVEVAIYSRSTEALIRKEEVVMALGSNYAKNQQALNAFTIGKLGNLVSLSNIDGAAIPFFFNLSFNIQYAVTKQQATDYFDTFELDDVITNP